MSISSINQAKRYQIIARWVPNIITNTAWARNGTDVVDYFSFFMQGFALGPFAILGSFSPQAQTRGTAAPLFWGGLSGTIAASSLYLNSFA
jgi:hypothetical protein